MRPIKVGGSFVSAADPAKVAEDFQMAADGGLGKLQDIAEFGDAQLLTFQQPEQAQTGGIGQRAQPA